MLERAPCSSGFPAPRPAIADYPFTTKYPNLGRVQLDQDRSFVLADIPGLIEGGAPGGGTRPRVFAHIERAGILVHLIEPSPADGTDPVQNYDSIQNELREYDQALVTGPNLLR